VVILRQNGIILDPNGFFAGKRFFVLTGQGGQRHVAK
jgi:hypothetical protein